MWAAVTGPRVDKCSPWNILLNPHLGSQWGARAFVNVKRRETRLAWWDGKGPYTAWNTSGCEAVGRVSLLHISHSVSFQNDVDHDLMSINSPGSPCRCTASTACAVLHVLVKGRCFHCFFHLHWLRFQALSYDIFAFDSLWIWTEQKAGTGQQLLLWKE